MVDKTREHHSSHSKVHCSEQHWWKMTEDELKADLSV